MIILIYIQLLKYINYLYNLLIKVKILYSNNTIRRINNKKNK